MLGVWCLLLDVSCCNWLMLRFLIGLMAGGTSVRGASMAHWRPCIWLGYVLQVRLNAHQAGGERGEAPVVWRFHVRDTHARNAVASDAAVRRRFLRVDACSSSRVAVDHARGSASRTIAWSVSVGLRRFACAVAWLVRWFQSETRRWSAGRT